MQEDLSLVLMSFSTTRNKLWHLTSDAKRKSVISPSHIEPVKAASGSLVKLILEKELEGKVS